MSRPLIVVPDGARQLSKGLCVEASVVARLLRIRLLVIDASVVVAPADVKGRERPATPAANEPLAPVAPQTRSRPIGERLAAAERYLSEGATRLT